MDVAEYNGRLSKAHVLRFSQRRMMAYMKKNILYPSKEHWEIMFNKVVNAMSVRDFEKIAMYLYKVHFGECDEDAVEEENEEDEKSCELCWKMWGDFDIICQWMAKGYLTEVVSKETGKKEFVSEGGDYEFRWREYGYFCEKGATTSDVEEAKEDGSLLRTFLRMKGVAHSNPNDSDSSGDMGAVTFW